MDEHTKKTRFDLFAMRCKDEGIPVTVQRRVILDTVLELDNHPTADQVLSAVADRIPGISRATVYRTLDSLARMGVIKKACHPGSAVRYDRRIEVHHHLICVRCDDMIDVIDERLDRLPIPDTSSLGFDIIDSSVQLRGICRRCKQKEEDQS